MPNREINPLERLNVVRDIVHWWNGRKMDKYAGAELDRRYEEYRHGGAHKSSKSVIDIVLHAYITGSQNSGEKRQLPKDMDPEFHAFAIRQIRLFLFVGHDSMSTTLCYTLYLLSKAPEALERIRDEHDRVFGTDRDSLGSVLASSPELLNELPYTAACLKETLRLFPPGSGIREGVSGVDLVDSDGRRYPTDGMLIWILHTAMHNAPEYWPHHEAYLPDRWLVEPGHELYPPKGAWRAFEFGPRNCIGQSLAMMELKLVMAFLAREFDFQEQYTEIDRDRKIEEIKTYRNERAYLMERGSAHPADLMPCKISMSSRSV